MATSPHLRHLQRADGTDSSGKPNTSFDAKGPTGAMLGCLWTASDKPVAYLLAGLTGSGKTTFAKTLEASGVTRLSVDEEVFARHGRHSIDYPEHEYPDRERPVVEHIRQRLVELIRAGHSVVLDYGLWTRNEREDCKRLVEQAGGSWRLLYFLVDRHELLRRLTERNHRDDANALTVTARMLDEFTARFQPPSNEGEEIIQP